MLRLYLIPRAELAKFACVLGPPSKQSQPLATAVLRRPFFAYPRRASTFEFCTPLTRWRPDQSE